MAKWQLTLIQGNSELRKFGECRSMVYATAEDMLKNIGFHLKSSEPYTILIKKSNRPCGRKWVVECIEGIIGKSKVKRTHFD